MATTEPQRDAAGTDDALKKKKRSPWLWVSLGLAAAVIGLLIWGLNSQSDLDHAEKEAQDLQSQVDNGQQNAGVIVAAVKNVVNDLEARLGAANEDLAASEQKVKDAETAAANAEQEAAAAEKQAAEAKSQTDKAKSQTDKAKSDTAEAKSQTDKANAEAEQAKAEAEQAKAEAEQTKAEAEQAKAETKAATSKLDVAAGCAKSFVSAFGALVDGQSADDVKQQLQTITADCKAAFAGT